MSAMPAYAGEWKQDDNGWSYQEENGIRSAYQWKKIENKWYYFTANGYRVTGWQNIDNGWYYFDETDGALLSNRWIDDYYVGSDGRKLTATWIGKVWVNDTGKKTGLRRKSGQIPLKSFSLKTNAVTLMAGATTNLVAEYLPANTTDSKSLSWKSSDPSVAEVSKGKISAKAEGTAVITVTMGNYTAECTVTVVESKVCETALSLLGAQYIWGGNGPQDGGVDCSGLLMYAYTQNGYDFGADLNANNFSLRGQEVSREELLPGDAICCCLGDGRYLHILLYLGDDMVVASECGGPTVCTAQLSCEQHTAGTVCNCRVVKRPLNENDLLNAKFVRMDAYKSIIPLQAAGH